MATKLAQANLDNGTTYDVLHYETQAGQVKVLDVSGNVVSDINEMLFNGKSLQSPDLNTLLTSGIRRVKGATNAPTGMVTTNTYIFNVDAIDVGSGVIVAHQTFYDHVNHETYHRTINGGAVGTWIKIGKAMADQVAKIGDLSTLKTTVKDTVVNSVNELKGNIDTINNTAISGINNNIDTLNTQMSTHTHDTRYLQLSGGSLTNTTSMANNKSFAGKNTSGSSLNIGKVNGTNDVVLGDATAKAIIQAKTTDISITDGTNTYSVYHSGNDGTGSGLDADTVHGVDGSKLARLDTTPFFTKGIDVMEGTDVILRATSGSNDAGDLVFQKGDGTQLGRLLVDPTGEMQVYSGGNIQGHSFKPDGSMYSKYEHFLDATDREVRIRFIKSGDGGIGHFMNQSGQFGAYDWNSQKFIYDVDRDNEIMRFTNQIEITGRRLYIQNATPPNARSGDIWIQI